MWVVCRSGRLPLGGCAGGFGVFRVFRGSSGFGYGLKYSDIMSLTHSG